MGLVSAWLFFLNRTNSSSSYSWSWSLCCSFCCFSSWAGLCLSLAPPRIQIPPVLEHLAFNTNPFVLFVFFPWRKSICSTEERRKRKFFFNLYVGVGSSPENWIRYRGIKRCTFPEKTSSPQQLYSLKTFLNCNQSKLLLHTNTRTRSSRKPPTQKRKREKEGQHNKWWPDFSDAHHRLTELNSIPRTDTEQTTRRQNATASPPKSDSISIRICCCNLRSKLLKQILLQLRFSKHESGDAIDRSSERASERAKDKKKEKRERREEAGRRPTRLISSYLPSKISKLGR
jgi:hypothetical protein